MGGKIRTKNVLNETGGDKKLLHGKKKSLKCIPFYFIKNCAIKCLILT